MYEVNGWLKHAEEDIWERGCQPGTERVDEGNDRFRADTMEDLIEKLMDFALTTDKKAVLLNACDEIGRVDIQVTQGDDGLPLTESEQEVWKRGEKQAWLVNYSFRVERVQRVDVDVKEALKNPMAYE